MLKALFSVIKITVVSLFIFALLWMGLRMSGESTQYQAMDHPLMQKKFFLTVKGGSLGPPNSPEFFDSALSLSKELFLWVDVQMTKDAQLVLFAPKTLEEGSNGQGLILQKTLAEVQKYKLKDSDSTIMSLREIFIRYSGANFVINLVHQDPARAYGLTELIDEYKQEDHVILFSDYPEPLKYLRRESPRSLFALAKTELVQLNVLSSLFLEPIARMKADLVIAPWKLTKRKESLSPRLLQEMKRRQIKVIIEDHSDAPSWLRSQADGILTDRPKEFLSRL